MLQLRRIGEENKHTDRGRTTAIIAGVQPQRGAKLAVICADEHCQLRDVDSRIGATDTDWCVQDVVANFGGRGQLTTNWAELQKDFLDL